MVVSLSNSQEQALGTSICTQKHVFDLKPTDTLVKFPLRYQSIFKNVIEIPFLYDFVESRIIEIIDLKTREIKGKIITEDFEKFDFTKDFETLLSEYSLEHDRAVGQSFKSLKVCEQDDSKPEIMKNMAENAFKINENTSTAKHSLKDLSIPLIFIFGKEKFKSEMKSQMNKKFKESVSSKTVFVEDLTYKKRKAEYLIFQIKHLVNFVFIENSEHLHSLIRSFSSIYDENECYTPKTKKFSENEKTQYLKNLIQMIPGISESVSNAIVTRFPSFSNLIKGLENQESFCSLKITEEGCERNISSKVFEKLYKAFYCKNGNEKI